MHLDIITGAGNVAVAEPAAVLQAVQAVLEEHVLDNVIKKEGQRKTSPTSTT